MIDRFDVAIVGGGVSGSALATCLARAGMDVLLLEQTTLYPDIVRGEVMSHWGVKEAQTLGLYDTLLAAGGHYITRHIAYDELLPPETAEAGAAKFEAIGSGVQGQLALGHPGHRQALFDAAVAAGATGKRGVNIEKIELGSTPAVDFAVDGERTSVRTRLVIGADGRNSVVRSAAQIALEQTPPRNRMGGLLVENADGWDECAQSIGTNNDFHYFVFPQGGGRARLYGIWSLDQRKRFVGTEGIRAFLSAFRMPCCPKAESLAAATPGGPLLSYLNTESSATALAGEGVVLVGDAGGWSDPAIGQGLASAYRDVRIVFDILRSTDNWSVQAFAPYEAERRERTRRIAFSAELHTRLFADFDEPCRRRRARYFQRLALQDPAMLGVAGVLLVGPDALPAESFTPERRAYVVDQVPS